MDNTITITASITYPLEQIEKFADNRGYQTVIANPDYFETINPDGTVTASVDLKVIPNPESRTEFVKRWFKDQAITLFAVDFKEDAEAQAKILAKQIEDTAKEQLSQAITIE